MSGGGEASGLVVGMPHFLIEAPEKLNRLLGLNRKQRLRLVGLVPREVRKAAEAALRERGRLGPGELDRHLLVWQYGEPRFRRAAWEERLLHGPAGPPSLEAEALAEFMDPDTTASPEAATARIVERAWADTRERLGTWDALDEEAREICILRVFAVATLRDDPKVLAEGVRTVPDLASEFRDFFELEVEEEDAGGLPTEVLNFPDNHDTDGDTDGDADGDDEDDDEVAFSPPDFREFLGRLDSEPAFAAATERWRALCMWLADVAEETAEPGAEADRLDEMAEAIEALRHLAPDVRKEVGAEWADLILKELRRRLEERQKEEPFAWLDASLQTTLEQRWAAHLDSLTLDEMPAEFDRVFHGAKLAEDAVREALDEAMLAEQRVLDARTARPPSLFGRRAWAASLAELQDQERAAEVALADAQLALLTVLSPFGKPFVPAEESPPDAADSEPPEETEPPLSPVPPTGDDG